MKSLSVNIVLLVVLWALIGIWHPATQATTWGRPAWLSLINHFLNFSCWLWKVYVPQKKDLHNDIAYLHIDFPDGGLLNSKKVCSRIVSCSIGKLIQKYCTRWKFVSLFEMIRDSSTVKYSKATCAIRKFSSQSWSFYPWQASSQNLAALGFAHIFRTGTRGKTLWVSKKANCCIRTCWCLTYAWNRFLAGLVCE